MAPTFRFVASDAAPEANHLNPLLRTWMGIEGGENVPLNLVQISDATAYAAELRNKGTGGKHLKAKHSTGTPTLLDVTDSGVMLSATGEAAGVSLVPINGGLLWFGTAAGIPVGYSIVGLNRFPRGPDTADAAGDAQVGATGGASTHVHTSPNHTHTNANHDHGPGTLDHNHALQTTGAPSAVRSVTDDGTNQEDVAAAGHDHNVDLSPGATMTGETASESVVIDNTAVTVDSENHLPPWLRVYFIRRNS